MLAARSIVERVDGSRVAAGACSPVALVVTCDPASRTRACRFLHAHGYGLVTVDCAATGYAVAAHLDLDVVVLDARREPMAATRLLFELARRPAAPRMLLLTEETERWIGARFGVGTSAGRTLRELGRDLARSIRDDLRPTPPR